MKKTTPFVKRNWRKLYEKGIKPSIAVCGSPRSGKTSLIKNSPFCMYEKGNVITLEETPLESSGGKINRKKLTAFLERAENSDETNLLFGIWYCISCLNVCASENDIQLLNLFESADIPLVIILTKSDEVCEQERIHLKKSLRQFEDIFSIVVYSTKNPDEKEEMKLLTWSADRWNAAETAKR